jgi:hypothetical protein
MAGVVLCTASAGCSIVLDWEQRIDAGPTPEACSFKEPNDTLDAAALLTTSEMGPAAICTPGDHDFYRFNVPADNETVTISISFTNVTTNDLDINLYDPATPANPIARGLSFVAPEQLTCPNPPGSPACAQLIAGDYILEVFGASASVTNQYDISITIVPQ